MRSIPTVDSLRILLNETKNIKLLSDWNGNERDKITCECYCGNIFTKSLRKILPNTNPCGCIKRNNKMSAIIQTLKETKNLDIISKPHEWRGCYSCMVTVKCFCGNIFTCSIMNLKNHTGSCGCLKYQYDSGNKNYMWKGCGELSAHIFHSIKSNANKRGLEFDVTINDVWEQYILQNSTCTLSGLKLEFNTNHLDRITKTASLDRIDPTRGYTKGNVHWIHKTINKMKMDLSIERFVYLCNLLVNPIHNNVPNNATNIFQQNHAFKGYKNINNTKFKSIQRGARERNLNFDITINDMWDKYIEQNGYCALTGLPIEFKYKADTASLNRIDSSTGYTIDNIQWVHSDINTKLKQTLTENELKYWCKLICDYTKGK